MCRRVDLILAASLLLAGTWLGAWYLRNSSVAPFFYQVEFAPAVLFACGDGFRQPADGTALSGFLQLGTDEFDCSEMPDAPGPASMNSFQRVHAYLLLLVGLWWKVTGITWSGLLPVMAVMGGVSAALVYGIFRLAAGPVISAAISLITIASPVHLAYLPHLRDYAKTPFFLASVFALGLLLSRPLGRRATLLWSAAAGAVLGLGLGFRMDLLINLVPATIVILFLLPPKPGKKLRFGWKYLLVFLLAFLILAAPILAPMTSSGNSWHVVLLGLATPFDSALGVQSSYYEWGRFYNDGYVARQVGSYSRRVLEMPSTARMASPEYEEASTGLFLDIARRFPADMATRALGALDGVLESSYTPRFSRPSAIEVPPAVDAIYGAREALYSRLRPFYLWIPALAIGLLAAHRIRLALAVLLLLGFYAGYTVLQFNERHFFHLEFVSWWFLAFVLQAVWLGLRRLPRRLRQSPPRLDTAALLRLATAIAKGVAVVAAAAALTVAALAGLRAAQGRTVAPMVERLLQTGRTRLPTVAEPIDESVTLLRLPDPFTDSGRRDSLAAGLHTDYLVIELQGRCDSFEVNMTLRSRSTVPYRDYSYSVLVPLSVENRKATSFVFWPAYYWPAPASHPGPEEYMGPVGIEVFNHDLRCITRVSRVDDLTGLPVLLNLILPPHWRQIRPHQTLAGWEAPPALGAAEPSPTETWLRHPADARVSRRTLFGRSRPIHRAQILSAEPIVTFASPRAWEVDGLARERSSFLVYSRDMEFRKGSVIRARGTLEKGGFAIGLLKQGSWLSGLPLEEPGEFNILVEVPEDGVFAFVLQNYLNGPTLENRIRFSEVGIVDPEPARRRPPRAVDLVEAPSKPL